MAEEYLMHHGVLGMKWGIRRYQKDDGTRTPLGRRHQVDLNDGYVSAKTKRANAGKIKVIKGKRYAEANATANKRLAEAYSDYDKRIAKKYKSDSKGKSVAKNLLFTNAGEQTYNMARAAGKSRVNAAAKTVFDVNLGRAGTAAGFAIGKRVGAKIGSKVGNSAAGAAVGMTVGGIAGRAAGDYANKKLREAGRETSLQQLSMRNTQAKKYLKNKKK